VEYDLDDWDAPRRLPSGIATLAAWIASFGLVIPCMSQVWFTGPIAKRTGDIGFEVAFGVSSVLYLLFRLLETRILGHCDIYVQDMFSVRFRTCTCTVTLSSCRRVSSCPIRCRQLVLVLLSQLFQLLPYLL